MYLSVWSISLIFNSGSTLGLICSNTAKMAQLLYCFWNFMLYIKPSSSHCDFNAHFIFLLISVNFSVLFSNLLMVFSTISGIQFILSTMFLFFNWWIFVSDNFALFFYMIILFFLLVNYIIYCYFCIVTISSFLWFLSSYFNILSVLLYVHFHFLFPFSKSSGSYLFVSFCFFRCSFSQMLYNLFVLFLYLLLYHSLSQWID